MHVDLELGKWVDAPPAMPTPAERLAMVCRILSPDNAIDEVVIFEHGTAIVRRRDAILTAEQLMAEYDVPHEGEGSPFGDLSPVPFDDASILFLWVEVRHQGAAFSVLTAAEIEAANARPASRSPTEVLTLAVPDAAANADLFILEAGLVARRNRSLDAGSPQRVVWWSRHAA